MFNKFLNQMRRLSIVLFCTTFLFSACKTDIIETPAALEQGEVSIFLSAEEENRVVTKSTEANVPAIDDFEVEIYNSDGIRLYRDTYAQTTGKKILLNGGDYRLLAQYGDSLGVGFDVTYFAADQNFTVHGQTSESISAVAKMANVKVAVKFGENLSNDYPDFYARVKHPDLTKYLEFAKTETRAGYIPAGLLKFELYALVEGTWKYYSPEAFQCNPNDFMTFTVDTDPRVGDLTINVVIDDSVETVEKTITVPAEAAPQEAPTVSVSGFDSSNTLEFIEDVEYPGSQLDILAMAGIQTCTLNITDSPFLSALGIPAQVELTTADETVTEALNSVGIRWTKDMSGKRIACLDFSQIGKKNAYNSSAPFEGRFSLTITDAHGKTVASDVVSTVQIVPAAVTFAPADYNAFAKRISGLTASVENGKPELVTLEYSADQISWNEVSVASISGSNVAFSEISGLQPDTKYYLRTKYANKEGLVSSLTTEKSLQLENADMESWGSGSNNYVYAGPSDNAYWATRNNQTTSAGVYEWYCRNSGTYSTTDAVSGNAALLTTIGWGRGNTWGGLMSTAIIYNISAAYLALGVSNTSGQITTKGIEFSSRPDAVGFYNKYSAKNGSRWEATVEVYSGDTVIGTASISGSSDITTYQQQKLDIVYSDVTKKATKLYLYFTNDNKGSYSKSDLSKQSNPHRYEGAVLKLDNISIEY